LQQSSGGGAVTSDARGTPKRRRWIKLHTFGILHGSINYQLSIEEQMVWVKLLAFAGDIGREGQISDNDGRPLPPAFVAHQLQVSEELLKSTLEKCKEEGRITEDAYGIHITNWKVYQSEYERQRPYRRQQQGPSLKDPTIGTYRVGKKRVPVLKAQDGTTYYRDDKGEPVIVIYDETIPGYREVGNDG
jgi:hypothetical protein